MTRYLVTSALPYANGPIHFGHVAGAYLPADIWVRYRRMRGDEVLYLCGTDEHGVAITIAAEQAGVGYRAFVDRWHAEIAGAFERFRIRFDHFSGTNRCSRHAELARRFFTNLLERGYVADREERQWFCPKERRFLADRYVEGTCPRCGGSARGDECRVCGQWLDALELKAPRCSICGETPEVRATRHWHLDLPRLCDERIREWFASKIRRGRDGAPPESLWKENVAAFVANMLADLKPRPITRDLPWGVPVPLPGAEGKVLYVWFDAPIGYISATAEWAESNGRGPDAWKEWWLARDDTRLVHFIGKDNIGFHTIVFPGMLHGQGDAFGGPLALPFNVPAMEFLQLAGRKFSTSGGWFIPLDDFFSKYSSDAIRWTLLQTLPETADAEFTWEDFQRRVNGELADVFGNFASRVLRFVDAHFDGRVPRTQGDPDPAEASALEEAAGLAAGGVARALDEFRFREAAAQWLAIARLGNQLFDYQRPWAHIRDRRGRAAHTLAACVRILEVLAATGAPFVPDASERLWEMLGVAEESRPRSWPDAGLQNLPDLRGRRIGHLELLVRKIEDEEVARENEALRDRAAGVDPASRKEPSVNPEAPPPASPPPAPTPAPTTSADKPAIAYEDFAKLDLRIGRIAVADRVPKADRLLRLEVEVASEGARRQILAGIAKGYDPATLVGRRVVVLWNLAPKKMMGLESQGMVLAAEGAEGPILLQPEREAAIGATVK